ncbi:MAG: DUF302 domain-containing protein [Aestuariivirga sp.]
MTARIAAFTSTAVVAFTLVAMTAQVTEAHDNGVVRKKSAYSVEETVERIKKDVAAKGIKLFDVIDQAKLAKEAGIDIRPSTLVIFGNPPLGTQFLSANQESGLDWPVRLLVFQDSKGQVWTAYTDFRWIARRHGITNRQEQFKKASEVISSITSAATP